MDWLVTAHENEDGVLTLTELTGRREGLSWVVRWWGLDGSEVVAILQITDTLLVYEDHAENLESLKLFSCNFPVTKFKNFRALKNLSLGWVNLTTPAVTTLLSNCLLLENFSLKRCWGLDYLDISAPSLTSLALDKCLDLKRGIRVDARTLRFLKYSGTVVLLQIECFRSIVEAVLDFGLEFEFRDCGQILHDFLFGIYYIKALTICSYVLQVITTAEDCLSVEPLPEVEHLTLKTALDAKEYYGITFFLNSCPRLETLSIDLTAPSRIFEGYNIDLPLQYHDFVMSKPFVLYPCVSSTLKVVEVKGFKGGKNELVALQYFIRHGKVLEKMAISVSKEEGPAGVFSLGLQYRQKAMQLLLLEPASPRLAILGGLDSNATEVSTILLRKTRHELKGGGNVNEIARPPQKIRLKWNRQQESSNNGGQQQQGENMEVDK
ncbi:hypothetical protein RJ639_047255 [Escallonia herrerae]|uniref:FBD domain-containing protein n=1 Tax=Escallonia herrerae TaxID=1293975 RepID=A0AA88W794_9ASTE|nr:hypothetical protein RJ639_047255 [Escallonia herrerae]